MTSTSQLALVAVVLTAGCSPEQAFVPPARLALPPDAVIAALGELEDSTGVQVLARPSAAALSRSGRLLAVGEYAAPPLVRVLDRATGEAWSFGPRGQGPGELISAHALEFIGDSVLLVLSGQRLERFTVRGEWLSGHWSADFGIRVSSITSGCSGRVFAYGVPAGRSSPDSVPWLFELDLDHDPSARVLLWTRGRSSWAQGALQGFDGGDDGILLWHRLSIPEVGYWIPCDGSEPTVWSHAVSPDEVEAMIDMGDRGGMVLTLPDTLFQGAAVRGSARVMARTWDWQTPASQVTSFRAVDTGCREVELLGDWRLYDAHADGLVVATSYPYPVVQLIAWDWFEGVLTPARCPQPPGGAGRPGSRGGR